MGKFRTAPVGIIVCQVLILLVGLLSCGTTDDGGQSVGDGTDGGQIRGDNECGRGSQNACGGCGALPEELGTPCVLQEAPADSLCTHGAWACSPSNDGTTVCEETIPENEVCDGIDNDCDGIADEIFDLTGDVDNCGACDNQCAFPAAVPICDMGECAIGSCQAGYSDSDGLAETGCEADCFPDDSLTDSCDGVDNDCDGFTDEDHVPIPCGVGVCRTSSACIDGTSYDCIPGDPWEEVETTCDGLDNNCDGDTDEGITLSCTNACGEGQLLCRGGEYPACSAQDDTGQVCIDISFFCETIPVRLEIALPTPEEELGVDLAFLFDRSGSFSDDLTTFRAKATELTNTLSADITNLGVGLSSFIDAPCGDFGGGSDFGYEVNLPVTTDVGQFETALNALDIRSGGDPPESQLEGMYQALTGEGRTIVGGDCARASIPPSDLGWRDRALSFLFLSTDNVFHHPSDAGYPYPHTASDVIVAARDRGTRIYFLQAGGTEDADAAIIATATGGQVFNLSADSREVVSTVTGAVFEALANTTVELVPEGDDLGFVTDISPRRLQGLDLLTNSTLDLTVTLLSTVDPTGEVQSYSFDLVFYVNDNEVSRRPVTIAIPAEDPKDCENRPPIIRDVDVPPSLVAGATSPVSVTVEEPDGNAVTYEWSATAGSIAEPSARSTIYTAPAVAGLVEFNLFVSDWEEREDHTSLITQVLGGDCTEHTEIMEVGLTEGRIVHEGLRTASRSSGTCGGDGSESVVVLRVHRSGNYRITAEPGESHVLYLRQPDCITELSCAAGPTLEVALDAGNYYLFVDEPTASGSLFSVSVEPM